MRHTGSEDGFTLVELLVTMVIIGVLAAIALPTFTTQRAKAYRSQMASDLHSVVTAEAAWLMDNTAATADPVQLAGEGYRQTDGVSLPHVRVLPTGYIACVTHPSAGDWLVYDSTTSSMTRSASDCA